LSGLSGLFISWQGIPVNPEYCVKEKTCSVLLLYSTSYAMHVEKILTRASVPCKMIPVPRHLSSSCGVCVRIASEDREKVCKILEETGVPLEGIHDA
jgi:hypothetical protein